MSKKVVIIGAGIIGLCTAYYLHQEGNEVTIIDKSDFTSGASFVNAGLITPSHIIPLAAPGVINKGIKWMLNTSSPFYVKPRLDYDFLKWSWLFKQASTANRVEKSIPAILDINILSRTLYEEIKSTNQFDFFYKDKGLLMLYKTDKAGEEELQVAEKAKKYGLKVSELSAEEITKLEPNVSLDIKGGIHYSTDRHMTPNDFMYQMKNYLVAKGVTFALGEEVKDVEVSGTKLTSIITNNTTHTCDELVVATGSWTQNFLKKLKINVPVQAGKGYRIDTYTNTGITTPSILLEAKVAVTPMNGFTRFAGTMEIGGINHKINKNRVNAITNAAKSYYTNLAIKEEEKIAAECGLRPCSPDGLPYIGRLSSITNVLVATGHAMMGWSLGPATGKLITELVSEQKTSIDIAPFHVERFS
ncbi:NAD(P)/FAD-dependent oxidoreductase [Tenacibaculum amylolyticum]|uniref:NAD(P)/FAD-dependent oxidoreductase n=1 Tax=Tenacibaculum amylolyticum TaxID=104269 RepID=UPI003894FB07